MTRETLMEMGFSEAQADQVMGALDGAFVTKDRFNTVNDEVRQLRETVKERDKQLESLKKTTGDADSLQKTISDLQSANREQAEKHASELHQLRLNVALDKALAGARARDPVTVRPLLDLDKVELLEDGTVKGLDEQVKTLRESGQYDYLFVEDNPAHKITGMKPGEPRDGLPKQKKTKDMTYEELVAHMESGGKLDD